MNNFMFTVIAVCTNGEHFQKTVESIVSSTDKLKNTQLILADATESEDAKKAADFAKSVSDNVLVLTHKGKSEAFCLNSAKAHISGRYTIFAEEGTVYTKKEFRTAAKDAARFPDVCLTMKAVTLTKDETEKTYARFPSMEEGRGDVINLFEEYRFGQATLSSYFFRSEDIKNISFDESLYDECKKKFVLEALLENPKVFIMENCSCFYTYQLENDNNLFSQQYNEWYYTPSLKNFMIPFMTQLKERFGEVPKFVQYTLTQLICAKYANNYYENDKGVLSAEQAMEFYNTTCETLMLIENSVYTEAAIRCKYILRSLWMQLLFGKLKKAGKSHTLVLQDEAELNADPTLTAEDRKILLHTEGEEDARITTLKNVGIQINQINYANNKLEFDAEFTGKAFIFDSKDVELFVEYAGKKIKLEEYPVYPLMKCFGLPYTRKYSVHFYVPTENLDTITFGYNICGTYQQLPIHFATQFSRLRLRFKPAYWKFNTDTALAIRGGNTLYTFRCKGLRHFGRELALYTSMFLKTRNKFFAMQCIGLRSIFRLTKPFFKNKRILVTFDKLYKAGDNGEYFWKYANKVDDNVETYYVVSDTSLDCKRLMEYDKKHTLIHHSLRSRLVALNMEAVVATHTMVMQYCGFPKYLHPYFLDLWNVKVICIQHGLTVQQLAQYQRRTYDNTTLYCLASKYEKQNLMHPVYGFDEDMLKLNGLARYDGLKNNDKKTILITPTWRRNVVSQGIAYKKKPYNELFKTTEYFRLYNTLIHDKKLIETAKKYGYKITYLLHPAMSPQLEDFDSTGYVKVIAASGDMNYEEILTQSSLMVTDYSGVQFDFAYMRKPIVYYHPDTLPPHYEAGGIDYPTQGFGPICTNHDTLVDTVCRFIENECAADDEYKKRADDFFEFDDYNNCQRIYDEILEFLKKK